MKHLVVLIHGTWARKAKWTRHGSALRNALQSLPDSPEFFEFDWSGGNSFRARSRASGKLTSELKGIITASPSVKITLIAHSHGGNVALAAMEDVEVRSSVTTFVCLSTPFIVVSENPANLSGAALLMYQGISWTAVAVIYAIALVSAVVGIVLDTNHWLIQVVVWVVICGLTFFARRYLSGTIEALSKSHRVRVGAFIDEHLRRDCSDLNLLVLRPVADEASGGLTMTQFAAWLIAQVWSLIVWLPGAAFRVVEKLDAWSKRNKKLLWYAATSLVLLVALLILIIPYAGWDERLPLALVIIAASVIYVPALYAIFANWFNIVLLPFALVAVLLGIMLLLPTAIVITLAALPFGLSNWSLFPSLRLTAEAAPTGRSCILQLPARQVAGLMHSTTYDDPYAVDAVVKWVKRSQHAE